MTSPLPAPRQCRSSGAALIFARTAKGEVMPLNAEATTVYAVRPLRDLLGVEEQTLADHLNGHVPHWATCPKADAFRRKKS